MTTADPPITRQQIDASMARFRAMLAELDAARCRRCGGTGEVDVMQTIDADGTQTCVGSADCPGGGPAAEGAMRIVMHGHHADNLFSFFNDEAAVADRRTFVATAKPAKERELRLALMQDVTDLLPRNEARAAYETARAAYETARAASETAWQAYVTAWQAYETARAAYETAFDAEAFHREHCHPRCPWDGRTIFARGVGVEVLA